VNELRVENDMMKGENKNKELYNYIIKSNQSSSQQLNSQAN
jgi:hypothetical protein